MMTPMPKQSMLMSELLSDEIHQRRDSKFSILGSKHHSTISASQPPKKLRKRERELLLHSETTNASDEEDEIDGATRQQDIHYAFTRR